MSEQPKLNSNFQQFALALLLLLAVVGFLFYGNYTGIIDKEVTMFMLGSITTAFILGMQFYFRRGQPQ